jgi:hypothetical protein
MTHPTHPRLDCPSPICAPLPRRARRPTANETHEQRSRELYEEARAEFGVPGDETLAKRAADQASLREDKISQRELRRRVTLRNRRAKRSIRRVGLRAERLMMDDFRSEDGKTMTEEARDSARALAYMILWGFTVIGCVLLWIFLP